MRAPAKHPETTIWAYGVHQFRRNNKAYIHHGFNIWGLQILNQGQELFSLQDFSYGLVPSISSRSIEYLALQLWQTVPITSREFLGEK